MNEKVEIAQQEKRNFSHFGFEANKLKELKKTFIAYAENCHFDRRRSLHTKQQAELYKLKPGEFIAWKDAGKGSDLMLYGRITCRTN